MKEYIDIEQLNIKLFNAATEGDYSVVKDCLAQGADINSQYTLGATPLFVAVTENKLAVAKLLIESGADIELAINTGTTPLYKSSRSCFPRITKLLLENGANKESLGNGYLPIYAAISQGCLQDVKILLKEGALTHLDTARDDPLMLAVQEKDTDFKHKQIHRIVMENYWQELEANLPKITEGLDTTREFQVVVVRYDEDLSWLNKEFKDEKIIIYNKGKDDLKNLPAKAEVIKISNVGWFGGSILHHLATKYESLADRTLFLQGEPYDQHVFLPLIKYKGNIESECQNIIAKCVTSSLFEKSNDIVDITQEMWDTT